MEEGGLLGGLLMEEGGLLGGLVLEERGLLGGLLLRLWLLLQGRLLLQLLRRCEPGGYHCQSRCKPVPFTCRPG